jgi:hypothetical protein
MHLDMSGQQEPVLLLDMFIQEPELHLEVSRLQEPVLLLHCKKRFAVFPSPGGMSLTKPSLAGNNLIIPALGEGRENREPFFTVWTGPHCKGLCCSVYTTGTCATHGRN